MIKSFLLLAALALSTYALAAEPLRQTLNFNRDWKFQAGDHPGAEAVAFDDTGWQAMGLPHSFSMPYFLNKDFYVGYGWYRKTFDVPAAWTGKRVFLEFEAAFQDAEIFVNGKKAGSHQGGYVGFQIDITTVVNQGTNTLAVRLNNNWNARLAPRAGEHAFSGGIYRNAWLVVTDPLHVTWCGTSVTTPAVGKDKAVVKVRTEVRNDSARPKQVEIRTAIMDPQGKVVASFAAKQSIDAGATATFDQLSPAVTDPRLWHPDHPHLYKAVSQIYDGSTAVDRYETTFGIRWFEWSATKGFLLNGEHLYLRGANVHQDHAGWGDAVTDAGAYRDVRLMKEAGFNFIRGSHYPHSPAFTRACDELGMVFWSENCFWGIGGFRPDGYWNCSTYPVDAADEKPFEESVRYSLAAMVRIHRNSASIMAWSVSNEPFFTEKSKLDEMTEFLKELVEYSRQLDPTRPAAVGGAQRPLGKDRIDKIGDIAGYNGDGAKIPEFQNPGIPNLVSEYGSVTADRPGKYQGNWADLQQDKGDPVKPWRSGISIWCGFDHGSIAGENLAKMGIVDYFRIPKRAWYFYRNEYARVAPPEWPESGTPAGLRLEGDKLANVRADGTDDVHLLVTVLDASGKAISNSPPVKLEIVSGPGEFPTGPVIEFAEKSDIRIMDGQAAIEFRSYHAGPTVIRATSPGLKPAELKISFVGDVPFVPGETPVVAMRPYVRYDAKTSQQASAVYGPDNPTFASSSAPGSSSGYAADGKADTAWKPAADDRAPSIILDTEKGLSISLISLLFPDKAARSYRVDVSGDRESWKPVADSSAQPEAHDTMEFRTPADTRGRYVRISFADPAHAALGEIKVTGTITR